MLTAPVFGNHSSSDDDDTIDLPATAPRKSMNISLLTVNTDEEKQHVQAHDHQYNSNRQQVLQDLHNEFLIEEESRKQASEQRRQYWFWWLHLLSILLVLTYGALILIGSMVTYTDGYRYAAIIRITHPDILSSSLATACLCVLTAFIGIACLNHHRRKSSIPNIIYVFLLWGSLCLICVVGYFAYKHNLSATELIPDLRAQWHTLYSTQDHIALQRQLNCCGFDHPADKAVFRGHCRPDTLLPGCSYKMTLFEQSFLFKIRTAVLTLIPAHIIVIIVTVLCSTNIVDHLLGSNKPTATTTKEGSYIRTLPPFAKMYIGSE